MYHFLKKILKTVLPQSLLFSLEGVLRWPLGLYYRGNNHQCTICNQKLSTFIKLENGELICPACGSLPRTRRLWQVLFDDFKIQGKILHFSPSRSMYRRLKNFSGIEYISTDFENEFLADRKYDITGIAEADESFDYIICYHVLEHIEKDELAMQELYRVLKKGGKALIQTPFKEGKIYENQEVRTPEDRKIHFGQEDHVRIYSVAGLKRRLENTGFKVNVLEFKQDDFLGLKEGERVLLATK